MKTLALVLSCISLALNIFNLVLMIRNARELKNIGRITFKGEKK